MKNLLVSAALLTLGLSGTSSANEGPKWTFVQAGYLQADIEDTNIEPTGFGIGGSHLVGENVLLVGQYSTISDDIFGIDVDLNSLSLGLGYKHSVTSVTDVYTVLSYEYVEFEGGGGSVDENGYGATVGIRSMVNNNIELSASMKYIDIDGESDTAVGVAAYYYITPQFAVSAGYSVADDVDTIGLSARYTF